ncbi:hypothetical protein [Actinoplanes sp. NPDC026670]|uniref:NACHT and WD repeat domain-containing protein n=1 Tax=Actinoplanes sp. NPDC026670 TaxID=3154700 RepID=UPI0033DAB82B
MTTQGDTPATVGDHHRSHDLLPYLGLAPFEERHARLFHGRRALTEHLLQRLREQPPGAGVLLVLGPSGAGKSSLLRAGLMGSLAGGAGLMGSLAGGAGLMGSLAGGTVAPGSGQWPRRVLTPTAGPLLELAACLAGLVGADAMAVHRALLAEPAGAHVLVRQSLTGAGPDARLVLVVDQLEELFTLGSDPAEQGRFLTALHSLAAGGGALVVAGIRGDFLDQALAFPEIRDSAEAGVFPVGAMCESELRAAITGPAAEAGVRVPEDVCAAILDDLRERGESGSDSGALPLLSQVMFLMWQSGEAGGLTLANYHRCGGVSDIVRTSAERVYESLDENGRDLARRIFLRLTALTDGRLTRRPRTRAELLGGAGDERVLEAFAGARLITVADETVTITHEEVLRSWTRLHDWLRPDLADQELHRSLTEDVRDWQNNDHDPSYLYTGHRLRAADEAARRWNDDDHARQLYLDVAAAEFLQAGRRRAGDSRRRVHRATAAAAVLVVAITAGAGYVSQLTTGHSEEQRLSTRLASASRVGNVDRGTAEQLAAAALQVDDTPEALTAAGVLLADASRVLPARDGRVEIGGPRGELMATMGVDTVWFWDAKTGHPIDTPLTGITGLTDIRISATGIVVTLAAADPAVRFWDPAAGRELGALPGGQTGTVEKLVLGNAGRLLATCGTDGVVRLWNPVDRKPKGTLTGHVGPVLTGQFSPDGKVMVTIGADRTMRLWDVATGRQRGEPNDVDPELVTATAFSSDGSLLAAAVGDDTVKVWSAATGAKRAKSLIGHDSRVITVAFAPRGPDGPDDLTLASSDEDGTVRLWDAATMKAKGKPLLGHAGLVHDLRFSADGDLLATAGDDDEVQVWRTATGEAVGRSLSGHDGPVRTLRFEPDDALITGSGDGTVRLWDKVGAPQNGHSQPVNAVTYSPDGSRVATAGNDGTVRLWDPATRLPKGSPVFRGDTPVRAVAFQDRDLLATADDSGAVRFWDLATGKSRGRPLTAHSGTVWALDFSPGGKTMATGGEDGTVRLWDPETRSPIGRPLTGHAGPVRSVRFQPDGRRLVTGGADGTIRWWNVDTGAQEGAPISGHTGAVYALAFSRNRTLLASGGQDGLVRLWDADSRQQVFEPMDRHNRKPVWAVAFNSDDTLLASGGDDRTARLWDTATGEPEGAPIAGHAAAVSGVAFQPGERTLTTVSGDRTVRFWDIGIFLEPRKALCDRVGGLSEAIWRRQLPDEPYVPTCT